MRVNQSVVPGCANPGRRDESRRGTLKRAPRLRGAGCTNTFDALFSALVVALLAFGVSAQEVRKVPAVPTSAASGREMYRAYCANCHGLNGKGNRAAASKLGTAPTDLTLLARHNSGRFPEMRVFNAIAGDARVPAHGRKDMPVWGTVFQRLNESDVPQAKLRIRNLTKYIESMQAR
jgi:mono/diheme cytochrome c family protein